MQSSPATPKQLKRIEQLLSEYPQMGRGVHNLARSIASYDGNSAIRYVKQAIATRPQEQEKTASQHAIAC